MRRSPSRLPSGRCDLPFETQLQTAWVSLGRQTRAASRKRRRAARNLNSGIPSRDARVTARGQGIHGARPRDGDFEVFGNEALRAEWNLELAGCDAQIAGEFQVNATPALNSV